MLNWIKKKLGIESLSESQKELQKQMDEFISNGKRNSAKVESLLLEAKSKHNELALKIGEVELKIGPRRVIKKLEGYKSDHEYIEISMKIYILDNGWRKENKPFVKSDENGVVDEYNSDIGPDAKMRCYMLKKIILPGYGKDDQFDPSNEEYEETYEYFFGKSYRELVDYMREFNYHRVKEELCTLNFYEI